LVKIKCETLGVRATKVLYILIVYFSESYYSTERKTWVNFKKML